MREIKGDGKLERRTVAKAGPAGNRDYRNEVARLVTEGWWVEQETPGLVVLARQQQRMLTEG